MVHPARPAIPHARICAWLHVLSGVAVMLLLSASLAYLASHYSGSAIPEQVKALLGSAGVAIGTAVCLVAGVELIGGVAFLAGKPIGRPMLLLSSSFQLINLPIGTALAVYSYWALLRAPSGDSGGDHTARS
ncbi:MAG: hypothetical protein IPG57_14535 [Burkholderiales bacterium]|jgi:succinate dehydrogenase/fumarate reductase cytochrome b subunit|nr:hypothetical protein [Burkholderiales bacterium]